MLRATTTAPPGSAGATISRNVIVGGTAVTAVGISSTGAAPVIRNNCEQFDTNTGAGPFTFTLGTGSVIAGWDQGLVGMKVGGLRQLIIPPSLAYGAVRYGSIPQNSVLVFEIELTDVQARLHRLEQVIGQTTNALDRLEAAHRISARMLSETPDTMDRLPGRQVTPH